MRLLIVAPYPVLPDSAGGKIRTIRLARELAAKGVDVTVLTPYHPKQSRSLSRREPFRLTDVKYPFVLPALFTGRPFPYGHLITYHPGLGARLRQTLKKFDIVQFEQCFLAGLVAHVPEHVPIIYNSQNVDADYIGSECQRTKVREIAMQRVARLERLLIERAAHVFVCSRKDESRFKELYDADPDRMSLAVNGVAKPQQQHLSEPELLKRHPQLERFSRRALFSGSNVPHNVEAARFLIEKLAPAVKDRCAIVIHGGCAAPFRHIQRDNLILDPEHTTFVDYAIPGTIGLNPVEQGSGTNLKVLHLLAHGLPVVSTPFGMRGYDDLLSFVNVCDRKAFVRALTNPEVIAPPDLDWLHQRYGWPHVADGMLDVFRSLTGASRATISR